ncbi:MAG: hypothetical protein ACYC2H_00325 [Thermoplasmatota archaeon]
MSHALQHAAVVVFAFVGLAMVMLAIVGAAAYRRKPESYLLFITLAFFVFFLKSTLLVVGFGFHLGAPELYELLGSLLDLVIAGLLLAPFFVRK